MQRSHSFNISIGSLNSNTFHSTSSAQPNSADAHTGADLHTTAVDTLTDTHARVANTNNHLNSDSSPNTDH